MVLLTKRLSLVKNTLFSIILPLLSTGLVLAAQPDAQAQVATVLTTLASFGSSDGSLPTGKLAQGTDGSLYGTTTGGGTYNHGTVYRVTLEGTLTTLYSFTGGTDGADPVGGLVLGSDGNLYGTTTGFDGLAGDVPLGTVFQITPAGVLTTLHNFSGPDGADPNGGLVLGSDGNFYGTTSAGGTKGDGTVFQITPTGTLTTLRSFTDGINQRPIGRLAQDGAGNFYGATLGFGADAALGTIFKVTPAGAVTTLYNFNGGDSGGSPTGGLVLGSDGNFYGTTTIGGTSNGGTIFQITPQGGLTTLHSFSDGSSPNGDLVQGRDGNFYGTTPEGFIDDDEAIAAFPATLFQITPAGVFTNLYNFAFGNYTGSPAGGLVESSNGSFYGTAQKDGVNGDGSVFELTVTAAPAFFAGQAALTGGVYYLAFPGGNFFGYYSFLADPAYLYHFDLGYEYVFDANDGQSGVYLYDFASSDFFYTSPSFPFPYLYDFNLGTVLYYFPAPNNAGHYTVNPRYFYDFNTGTIITK